MVGAGIGSNKPAGSIDFIVVSPRAIFKWAQLWCFAFTESYETIFHKLWKEVHQWAGQACCPAPPPAYASCSCNVSKATPCGTIRITDQKKNPRAHITRIPWHTAQLSQHHPQMNSNCVRLLCCVRALVRPPMFWGPIVPASTSGTFIP